MTRALIVDDAHGLWGAQRWVERTAPLLVEHGITPVVLTPVGARLATAWAAHGGEVVTLAGACERSIRSASNDRPALVPAGREVVRAAANARRLSSVARAVRADVIVGNAHWTHLDVIAAAKLSRLPSVLVLHEECRHGVAAHLRGVAVASATRSIAVSRAVATAVPARWRHRITVVANGVDVSRWTPGQVDPSVRGELAGDAVSPVVLVLSRLDRPKGIDDAIRAVAATPRDLGMQLAIAGAPSLDRGWDATLRRLGADLLGERVRFLGERSDARELLRAADALVLASSVEGMPLSVLEAQACGTPVVAYATAGIPEVVASGRTGYLAARGDVGALAAGLVEAVTPGARRDEVIAEARASVTIGHDLHRQAKEVADVIEQAVGARR